MPDLLYEAVDVLIFDPVADSRSMLRASLGALGFRNVDGVATPTDFANIISYRHPDLVFCEVDSINSPICQHIRSLRWGISGYNPFTVIAATSWDKSEALIRQVINAGADDVILRPFSQGILAERIETMTLRRKGFVITYDYIGPDRRRDPTRTEMDLFVPPNTLRMKAAERLTTQATDKRLNHELPLARRHVLDEKLRVDAFQLGVLYRFLQDGIPTGEPVQSVTEKVDVLASTLAHEGNEAKRPDLVLWCNQAHYAVEMLRNASEQDTALRFLERAAKKLYHLLRPSESPEAYEAALDSAMANIRARQKRAGQQERRTGT